MRWFMTLAIAAAALSTNLWAHTPETKKVYVDAEKITISNEGIFLQTEFEGWIPLSSLQADEQGVYITEGVVSTAYYKCKSCGLTYIDYCPPACDECGETNFSDYFSSYWDD